MPLYDFKCETCGEVKEQFFHGDEVPASISCQCGNIAPYFPSFYYTSPLNAQRFSPVVVHRDSQGNVRFPASTDAPTPPGFEKVTLSDFHQVRKFEKEMEQRQSSEAAQWRQTKQRFVDGQLAANREAVDTIAAGGAWQGVDENGREITRHGLTEKGKRFLDRMREQSERKQAEGPRAISPAFFIEAFTQNASNREAHYDASTEWKRGRK